MVKKSKKSFLWLKIIAAIFIFAMIAVAIIVPKGSLFTGRVGMRQIVNEPIIQSLSSYKGISVPTISVEPKSYTPVLAFTIQNNGWKTNNFHVTKVRTVLDGCNIPLRTPWSEYHIQGDNVSGQWDPHGIGNVHTWDVGSSHLTDYDFIINDDQQEFNPGDKRGFVIFANTAGYCEPATSGNILSSYYPSLIVTFEGIDYIDNDGVERQINLTADNEKTIKFYPLPYQN